MTNPHAVSRRRPMRARPRLPRGPKPPQPMPDRVASRQPDEHAAPGSSPLSPHGPSSPAKPPSAPAAFDWSTAKTLSVKEAAFRLKKNPDTVYRWLRVGRLRGWQLGGRRCAVLVSEESVERTLLGAGEIHSKFLAAHSA